MKLLVLLSSLAIPAGFGAPAVRATGVIRAVHSMTVQVPRIQGQGGNLTLASLCRNGASVAPGDILASFDRSAELKTLRDTQSKLDDLQSQLEQKKVEQASAAEKRAADLQQAQADLKKAEIESRKGPVLSAIDRQKNEVKLADAKVHVESLLRSNKFHEDAERAELKVLELQRDRQRIAMERQVKNAELLEVHSTIKGMISLLSVWRNGSMGHAQEGDQLWPGTPLLMVFDPTEMEIQVSVGEPDGAVLVKGAVANVHLDAFPGQTFTAHFASASPAATAPLGSPVKTFVARFVFDQNDSHLLPDLSVAVDIQAPR